jgi:hypothetical protein
VFEQEWDGSLPRQFIYLINKPKSIHLRTQQLNAIRLAPRRRALRVTDDLQPSPGSGPDCAGWALCACFGTDLAVGQNGWGSAGAGLGDDGAEAESDTGLAVGAGPPWEGMPWR